MSHRAFTLVELLVVIAIIGLLSTVAVVSLGASRMNARNATRKANLVQISKALELYFADNGTYPSTSGGWCGTINAFGCVNTADSGEGGWIPNLAPTYMAILPRDPNTNRPNPNSPNPDCGVSTSGASNQYLYRSDDGTDYKLLAHCTPEGTFAATDPFVDTTRPTYSWAIYTPGAAAW